MRNFKFKYSVSTALCFAALCVAQPAQAQMLTGYEPMADPVPIAVPQTTNLVLVQPQAAQRPAIEIFMDVLEPTPAPPQPIAPQGMGVLTAFQPAVTPAPQGQGEPVDLSADNLQYDEASNIVTASGDVMLVQADRILRADEITYDLDHDEVVAAGNVVLNEPNGDIHLLQKVVLQNEMKDGFVEELYTQLADGSRLWAADGRREDAMRTIMNDARYTACIPCGEEDAKPAWQIKADQVTHDEETKTIAYKHAVLEVFGVPAFYTPYFAHPDGSVDQKSGFLPPTLGYRSELGAFVHTPYYWAIAPDQDATFGVMAMSEENPLFTAEYRRRWENAALTTDSSITYSGRTARSGTLTENIDDEVRGHLFAEGLWDINQKWRAGLDIQYASDDQYLRQYDFDREDVLENAIYAERFSGRNYFVTRVQKFQDLRIENAVDQPEVLPEMIASFIGEPGAVPIIGGRWDVNASFLGLQREGDDQDMNRLVAELGWKRRLVSDFGFVSTIDADIRGDLYNVRDNDPAVNTDDSSTETRAFGQLHMETSYPLQRAFERFQARIEPIVSATLAPNIDSDDQIPNEDSQDVQIDASNLFATSRFPGYDRIEDQSRVTYGLRTGLYGYDGSHINVFAGQSYRFQDDDNPFPQGSGLDEQDSDFVGEVSGTYQDNLWLNYRFQLDNQNFSSQRHEVDFYGTNDRFELGSRYLFAKALEGTNVDESREQLEVYTGYYMTPRWRWHAGGIQDFGDTPGLREAYVGLDYFGECLFLSLTGERELTDDATGDSGTEILLRIGLKNLGGEFRESTYNPGQSCTITNGF